MSLAEGERKGLAVFHIDKRLFVPDNHAIVNGAGDALLRVGPGRDDNLTASVFYIRLAGPF